MRKALFMTAAILTAPLVPLTPSIAAPSAEREVFGTAEDGARVDLVTLTNDSGMVVRISSRGGTITEILVPDRHGEPGNVVLSAGSFEAWQRMGGFNSIIGLYANRIGGGGFTLDGVRYELPANPQTGVTLHGGSPGFAARLFRTEIDETPERALARFTYVSADGENGFPGELTLTVTYSLGVENALRLEYEAVTTKPTVVNFTNHAYFTLGTHAGGPIHDQLLQVFAGHFTPTDEHQVPTGEIAPVDGTPFDFREPARIGERIYSNHPQVLLAGGIDHNFVLDGPSNGEPRLAVRLFDPDSGRRLDVRTTEPGVQIYTANHMNGSTVGEGGRTMRQSDAVAFETQHFPDSPNQPGFPSTVLRPGETFRSLTEFAFSTDAWEEQ